MKYSEKTHNNKLSWRNRIKLCWSVLTTGTYNPKDYKTIHEEEQWAICRQRDEEMNACIRPRTNPRKFKGDHSKVKYTDYYDIGNNEA